MKRKPNPRAALLDRLNKDEAYRIEYLNHALEHENQRMILAALRNIAKVRGGITRLAKFTGINRQHLYHCLSGKGNPTWIRIIQIFDDLGYPLRAVKKSSGLNTAKKGREFARTIVMIRSAQQCEGEDLLARSQAKRLMLRVENFKKVMLDFEGVQSVGPAFADEIFRVYKNEHPKVELFPINTSLEVKKMISRAEAADMNGGKE